LNQGEIEKDTKRGIYL